MTTIIVPAHNESQVIGRLLSRLVPQTVPTDLEVIVVANGCTDRTASVAASFGPAVRVVTLPAASKFQALAEGDRAARGFPRVYVDANVELGLADVRALSDAVAQQGVLAAAPERDVPLAGCPWTVRWYYDVWSRLPEVRTGLFARGVIAVSRAGYERIAAMPALLADDLAISLAFAPGERRIVASARVVIHPPRRFADLIRRRTRVAHGVTQLEQTDHTPASTARTAPADLMAILAAAPWLLPRMALFLMVTLVARLRARQFRAGGDFTTWLRDESSRTAVGDGAGGNR